MKRIYLRALVSFAFCQFGLAAGNDSLPPPVSDKIYTFQQIEQQKLDLNDKIVRIEIGSLLGDGKSHLPNGALRYDLKKSPAAFYFRVHLFPDPNAAAVCIAVGRQVSVANGKAIYSW